MYSTLSFIGKHFVTLVMYSQLSLICTLISAISGVLNIIIYLYSSIDISGVLNIVLYLYTYKGQGPWWLNELDR